MSCQLECRARILTATTLTVTVTASDPVDDVARVQSAGTTSVPHNGGPRSEPKAPPRPGDVSESYLIPLYGYRWVLVAPAAIVTFWSNAKGRITV